MTGTGSCAAAPIHTAAYSGAAPRGGRPVGGRPPHRPTRHYSRTEQEHNVNTPTLTPTTLEELDTLGANGPAAVLALIAPEVAKQLLQRNTRNRPLRDLAVDSYVRDITNGTWPVNGEAIKLARDGTVLDGQHRLKAIVIADSAVQSFIVVGLDPSAQETMDSGRKRTIGDAFALRGESNALVLAAIARRVWAWQHGDRRFNARYLATTAECTRLVAEHPELKRSAEIATRVRSSFPHIPQSILGVAHFLFNALDADENTWFFQRLADGATLPLGHPILALRARVTSERVEGAGLPEGKHMAYLVRTWNAMRDGRTLDRLVHPPKSVIPDPK
jgi:hypothetical protein